MTQQVFLKALKSISSFKWQDVPFSAWLYRIAHNQVVDHLRQKTRRPTTQLEEAMEQFSDESDNPQKTTELRIDIESLMQAVTKLTPSQREVIALRFTSDLPIAEVARIMGKSEGAIKAMQHSAVLALRRIMVTVD
jgi:RNA polymerase sigma-70 factor (ECF subfamily)